MVDGRRGRRFPISRISGWEELNERIDRVGGIRIIHLMSHRTLILALSLTSSVAAAGAERLPVRVTWGYTSKVSPASVVQVRGDDGLRIQELAKTGALDGAVEAAVSVSGTIEQIRTEDIPRMGALVRDAADEMARRLGWTSSGQAN